MSLLINNFKYRPEIDGLRCIAVLAVLLFHAGLGVPGGYIGVDVFFVISGYLITSLVVKDLENGKFTMAKFWERRIRRIFPALLVMTLVTVLIGAILLLPADYAVLGKSAAYQIIGLSNFYFWQNVGYFNLSAEEKPLLHTWSLAVEEQFYVCVPILLVVLFAIPRLRTRPLLLSVFGGGLVISFFLCVVRLEGHPTGTFFLLPTRAWELLSGSFIALLPPLNFNRAVRETLSAVGFGSILVVCFLYDKETPFPGATALFPCLGTSLFIIGAKPFPGAMLPTSARLLATRPFVFIGNISYSLYLWHWPVCAYFSYWMMKPQGIISKITIMALSLIIGILSWHYVEKPFRDRRLAATRRTLFVSCLTSVTILFAAGIFINLSSGIPSRLPPTALKTSYSQADRPIFHELEKQDILKGNFLKIGEPIKEGEAAEWLIWGDSHAMCAMSAFDLVFKRHGIPALGATHSATAPVVDYYHIARSGIQDSAPAYNAAILDEIRARKIRNTMLIGRWINYDDNDLHLPGNKPFEESLLKTVRLIKEAGSTPWVMLDIPEHPFNVPRYLALFKSAGKDLSKFCTKPDSSKVVLGHDLTLISKLREAGARIIDPKPAFLSHDGSHYVLEKDGAILYFDTDHLTTSSTGLLAEFLDKNLDIAQ